MCLRLTALFMLVTLILTGCVQTQAPITQPSEVPAQEGCSTPDQPPSPSPTLTAILPEDPYLEERQAMVVTGIIGWLGVPIVYAGNRVKASQHPAPVVGGGEDSGLAPIFLATLLLGVAACTLYYIVLLRVRVRGARIEDRVEELQIAEGWDR